jgi:FAD/FMN-containing dehydrogenase
LLDYNEHLANQLCASWQMRHHIPIAQKHLGGNLKHDISVAPHQIAAALTALENIVSKFDKSAQCIIFGHVGDGNLHFNVCSQLENTQKRILTQAIYHCITHDFNGSIAAEHGIGQLKKNDLKQYLSDADYTLLKQLKMQFDPKGILNPGVMLDF